MVRELLPVAVGADCHARDDSGETVNHALFYACKSGSLAAVREVLAADTDAASVVIRDWL